MKVKKIFSSRYFVVGLVLFILSVGIFLRAVNLNESLWYDELLSTNMRIGTVKDLLFNVSWDNHPPFYTIFMFFWIKIFGDSEISVRMPSFLMSLGSLLFLYLLARQFINKISAVLATFLLLFSPAHIWYSYEAKPYSAIMFFLLVALFSYNKVKCLTSKSYWYSLYFVSMMALVLTHYYGAIFLFAVSVFSFFSKAKILSRKRLIELNFLIFSLLFSFLIFKFFWFFSFTGVFGKFYAELDYLRSFNFKELWMLLLNWFTFGNSIWKVINPSAKGIFAGGFPMFFCQISLLFLLIRGVTHLVKEDKVKARDLIVYLFSLPVALLFFPVLGLKHFYIERSLLLILPFFYIFLAEGACSFKSNGVRKFSIILIVAVVFISLFNFLGKSDSRTVYKKKPDWRKAASYFQEEIKGQPRKLYVFSTAPSEVLEYYFRKNGLLSQAEIEIVYNYDKFCRRVLGNKIDNFYLLKNNYWRERFDIFLENVENNRHFNFIESRRFKGIKIFKFGVSHV